MRNNNLIFKPHFLIRNRHLQTIASSLINKNEKIVQQNAREMILDAEGVRLLGYYSPQLQRQSKGLVLLLHGWLGDANANYIVYMGDYLYKRGYSIFRLNLRDHGNSHHLNPGVFRSDRIDEVFNSTIQIAHLEPDRPLYIIGNSLGGNFAIRLVLMHSKKPISNLKHTIVFCPVIDPYNATCKLDNGMWIYLRYFRQKWQRDFMLKQKAYPDLYDFSPEIAAKTCYEMTDVFAKRNSHFTDAIAYFNAYTITPEMMRVLISPITIIPAEDDPIIPISDFYNFSDLSLNLQIYIQAFGGHVGFIDIFPFKLWACEAVYYILNNQ